MDQDGLTSTAVLFEKVPYWPVSLLTLCSATAPPLRALFQCMLMLFITTELAEAMKRAPPEPSSMSTAALDSSCQVGESKEGLN